MFPCLAAGIVALMNTTPNARRLRREQTREEQQLWRALRAGRCAGFKIRRQHPIGEYTLGFIKRTRPRLWSSSERSRPENRRGRTNTLMDETSDRPPPHEPGSKCERFGLLSPALSSRGGEGESSPVLALPVPLSKSAPVASLPLLGERVGVRGTAVHDYSELTHWNCRGSTVSVIRFIRHLGSSPRAPLPTRRQPGRGRCAGGNRRDSARSATKPAFPLRNRP